MPDDEKFMRLSLRIKRDSEFAYHRPNRVSTRRLVIRSIHVACRHQKLIHDMLGFHYDGGGGSLSVTPR
ncbi:MAG: hypothetical protein A2Y64_00185 [Candidatus Coatesbacteria bacterium RBG_13_66_14]|uniref:Uncharacterized protein n=1 Tax=Candidatus Coatesbacteria bacterium RBG_13_66_14 TaxID=1817816 RepID=A0A1F5FII5_9BACT|nr:MAG: hypothetical protein A2Y64_00185 [Candidatus Coatesbacteria bacterium RBG_13_66_14]